MHSENCPADALTWFTAPLTSLLLAAITSLLTSCGQRFATNGGLTGTDRTPSGGVPSTVEEAPHVAPTPAPHEVEIERKERSEARTAMSESVNASDRCAIKDDRVIANITRTFDPTSRALVIDGGPNGDSLVVFGAEPNEVSFKESDAAAPVTYPCVKDLIINMGEGRDTVVVDGLPGLSSVTVNAGGSSDIVRLLSRRDAGSTDFIGNGGRGDDVFESDDTAGWGSVRWHPE